MAVKPRSRLQLVIERTVAEGIEGSECLTLGIEGSGWAEGIEGSE